MNSQANHTEVWSFCHNAEDRKVSLAQHALVLYMSLGILTFCRKRDQMAGGRGGEQLRQMREELEQRALVLVARLLVTAEVEMKERCGPWRRLGKEGRLRKAEMTGELVLDVQQQCGYCQRKVGKARQAVQSAEWRTLVTEGGKVLLAEHALALQFVAASHHFLEATHQYAGRARVFLSHNIMEEEGRGGEGLMRRAAVQVARLQTTEAEKENEEEYEELKSDGLSCEWGHVFEGENDDDAEEKKKKAEEEEEEEEDEEEEEEQEQEEEETEEEEEEEEETEDEETEDEETEDEETEEEETEEEEKEKEEKEREETGLMVKLKAAQAEKKEREPKFNRFQHERVRLNEEKSRHGEAEERQLLDVRHHESFFPPLNPLTVKTEGCGVQEREAEERRWQVLTEKRKALEEAEEKRWSYPMALCPTAELEDVLLEDAPTVHPTLAAWARARAPRNPTARRQQWKRASQTWPLSPSQEQQQTPLQWEDLEQWEAWEAREEEYSVSTLDLTQLETWLKQAGC